MPPQVRRRDCSVQADKTSQATTEGGIINRLCWLHRELHPATLARCNGTSGPEGRRNRRRSKAKSTKGRATGKLQQRRNEMELYPSPGSGTEKPWDSIWESLSQSHARSHNAATWPHRRRAATIKITDWVGPVFAAVATERQLMLIHRANGITPGIYDRGKLSILPPQTSSWRHGRRENRRLSPYPLALH